MPPHRRTCARDRALCPEGMGTFRVCNQFRADPRHSSAGRWVLTPDLRAELDWRECRNCPKSKPPAPAWRRTWSAAGCLPSTCAAPDLRWPIPAEIERAAAGPAHPEAVRRRAKYLLLDTAAGSALLHLGMSGSLRVLPAAYAALRSTTTSTCCWMPSIRPRRAGAALQRPAALRLPAVAAMPGRIPIDAADSGLGPEPILPESASGRPGFRRRLPVQPSAAAAAPR
jgi:hypothetical protein